MDFLHVQLQEFLEKIGGWRQDIYLVLLKGHKLPTTIDPETPDFRGDGRHLWRCTGED